MKKPNLIRTLSAVGLAAAPAAAMANGGDTFATATLLPPGPLNFTDTGTTVGATSNINSLALNVNGLYTTAAGPDVFYRIDIVVGGTITFTLTPTSNWDPSIYLTNSSLATSNPGLGAGSGRDAGGAGAAESFTFNLTPGTYFLAIDSFYSSTSALGSGGYTLSVTGTAINAAVPEPTTVGLLAMGAVVGAGALWRRRRAGAAA